MQHSPIPGYPYSPLLLQTRTQARQLGDEGDAMCQSCFVTGATMLVFGGLLASVLILAVSPALRLHKEYKT